MTVPSNERLIATVAPLLADGGPDNSWNPIVNIVAPSFCSTDGGTQITSCLGGTFSSGYEIAHWLNGTGNAQIVLVVIDGYLSNAAGPFRLTTTVAPPPAGDFCGTGPALTPGVALNQQSFAGFVNDYRASVPGCMYDPSGPDRSYTVAVPTGQRLTVVVSTDAGLDTSLSLVNGGAAACTTQCVTADDSAASAGNDVASWVNSADSTQTIQVVVDGQYNSTGHLFGVVATLQTPGLGESCANPNSLVPGVALTGQTLWSSVNDYRPGQPRCLFGFGPDRVYSVSVPPENRLNVIVTPDAGLDTTVTVIQGAIACASGTCFTGINELGSGTPDPISYDNFAGTTETVLVVVDTHDSNLNPAHTFNISASVSALPQLLPGGETCMAPVVIASSGTIRGSTAIATNDYMFPYAPESGCFLTADAPDVVYAITVPSGVRGRFQITPRTPTFVPTIHLIDSASHCGTLPTDGGNTVGATCIVGTDTSVGGTASVSYDNLTTGDVTLLLVIDGSYNSSSRSGNYDLTTSAVAIPPGEHCARPEAITPGSRAGQTLFGYANNVSTANSSSCTTFGNSGPDRVYSIVVPAMKTLTATVTPSATWDAAIYIVDPSVCGLGISTCLAGRDTGGTGSADTATFTNTSAVSRTVYIVIDRYSSGFVGEFTLNTSIP